MHLNARARAHRTHVVFPPPPPPPPFLLLLLLCEMLCQPHEMKDRRGQREEEWQMEMIWKKNEEKIVTIVDEGKNK